jgi:hypothetical protein
LAVSTDMVERPSPQRAAITSAGRAAAPLAFLSYSHAESDIALAFRDALAARGLDILIDVDHLKPAEDITEFARRSVRTADATVCLVSATSLSSQWVVLEAATTLDKEHVNPAARLIACATDQAFFADDFRLRVTERIDTQLAALNALFTKYLNEQLDLNDLSLERSRLLKMRGSLGDLLGRLRNSLTLSLTPDTLLEAAARVADHLRELRGQAPSQQDPRDIRGRAEELRRHLWEGRTDDALDRLLDFVREFSDQPKHIRDATFLANTLRRIERAEKDGGVPFSEAEKQRQPTIYKFLELIDEVEVYPQLPVAS